jgi:DNA end-binding protein Ku
MAHVVWKGDLHLGFDLMVPVQLVAAARENKISFSQVNPETGAGVSQQVTDKITGEVLKRSDLVKETKVNGQMVRVTDEELKNLLPAGREEVLEISEFVKAEEVDPLFFLSSYYIRPAEGAEHLFAMFEAALSETGYAAIGNFVRMRREYLVLIRPSSRGMVVHTLFYADEVREDGHICMCAASEEGVRELKKFIRARKAAFQPAKYEDSYGNSLQQLLEERAAKKAATAPDIRVKLQESVKKAKSAKRRAKRKSA